MGGGEPKDYLLFTVPEPEPTEVISKLRKRFPQIEIKWLEVPFSFSPKLIEDSYDKELFKDATILCTFAGLPKHQSDAPNLQVLQLLSAGSNHIQDHWIYTDSDVQICTASGIHGPQIAEWVILTHLVHTHKYKSLYELQKRHEWPRGINGERQKAVRDRVGLTVGVLGYGSIGRQVGRLAKAMGMRVLAYTAGPKDTPEKRKDGGFVVPGTGDEEGEIPEEWFSGLEKENLHKFLQQDLDWLVVAVPLTKETTHFLSSTEFRKLSNNGKRKVFVTNLARGPIIDQPALIEALKDGTLEGAALDVTDPEPLPEDSELWDLENVVLTPHISGSGIAYMDRALHVLAVNLERKLKGEKLINIVRRDRGY
jgi:phosphoglycerate dehydrogenase-like enzyme